MKRVLQIVVFVALTVVGRSAFARDVWIVRISGFGLNRASGGTQLWSDEVRVLNAGSAVESMRLIEASNGISLPISDPLPIPPGTTVFPQQGSVWFLEIPMAVFHLDVGDDVVVSSRLLSQACCPAIATPPPLPAFGAIPLPVFVALVPAGQQQVLVDTDLPGYSSRINLALFNASDTEAQALIEVISACDGRIVSTRSEPVPANSIIQTGIGNPAACSPTDEGPHVDGPTWVRVTMDQPGFAVAATLANFVDPNIPIGISVGAH